MLRVAALVLALAAGCASPAPPTAPSPPPPAPGEPAPTCETLEDVGREVPRDPPAHCEGVEEGVPFCATYASDCFVCAEAQPGLVDWTIAGCSEDA